MNRENNSINEVEQLESYLETPEKPLLHSSKESSESLTPPETSYLAPSPIRQHNFIVNQLDLESTTANQPSPLLC
jgi:hypothetical protein